MNKLIYLTLSGFAMVLAGLAMLLSDTIGVGISKIAVPLLFIAGGVMAYMFSDANKHHKIAKQYHTLQGIGMILFGVLIATIPENLGDFLQYVTYFMMTFGFIEIYFGFVVLNSGNKLNVGILFSRFIAGFVNLIGAVLILATSVTDEYDGLMIAGILTIIGGIGFMVFSYRIRNVAVSTKE